MSDTPRWNDDGQRIVPHDYGEWVRYADHVAAVAAAEQRGLSKAWSALAVFIAPDCWDRASEAFDTLAAIDALEKP